MQIDSFVNKNLDVRTRAGEEWTCLCPYHDDTSPSFSVNVKRGLFICFACGAKGTVAELAEYLKVGAPSVVVTEENEADRMETLLGGLRDLKEDKGDSFLPESYLARFRNHTGYWNQRGFSEKTVEFFDLGYDVIKDHAVVPLRDMGGRLVGVVRRQLNPDAMPRYLYPKGFKINQHLFNSHNAQKHEKIAIVEGTLDCIACHEAGIPAVAILGSYVSGKQYEMLSKLSPDYFVAMTDRDQAGRRAAAQIMATLGRRVLAPEYKKSWVGKDPADLTDTQRREMFDGA